MNRPNGMASTACDAGAPNGIARPSGPYHRRTLRPPPNRFMERSADWMDQARGDLAHARQDLDTGFYDWACFSAQQGAEKAVKAVFQKRGAEAWGHSVADLLDALSEIHTLPDELIERALALDKAYIPSRYPDAHPSGSPRRRYTKREASALIDDATAIITFCQDLLSAA